MNEHDKGLIQQLINLMANPPYFEFESHSVIEEMKKSMDAKDFIEPVFRMMESAPLFNFGNPGSLLHFIEATDGYESKLIDSINRTPSLYGINMLNRILNRQELRNRRDYMNILKDIMGRADVKPEVAKEAGKRYNKLLEKAQRSMY